MSYKVALTTCCPVSQAPQLVGVNVCFKLGSFLFVYPSIHQTSRSSRAIARVNNECNILAM